MTRLTIPPADVDTRPWVPVTVGEEVALPRGTRVRVEYRIGFPDDEARWVHPDDVPDPDADLIDDVARSLREAHAETRTWGHATPDSHWDEKAREVITKVRGSQA